MESLQDLNFKNINLYRRCIKHTTIFSKKKKKKMKYMCIYICLLKKTVNLCKKLINTVTYRGWEGRVEGN